MSIKQEFSPKQKVINTLKAQGYPSEVISGMMGNISVETGDTYNPNQKQYGGGPGRGLFQMEGKMLNAYNSYIKKTGLPNTVETQLGFMNDVLTSNKNYDIGEGNRARLKRIFEVGTPSTIADEFSIKVLKPGKPHAKRRMDIANQIYTELEPQ